MATVPSSTLQLSNPPNPLFPSSSSPRTSSRLKLHAPPHLSVTVTRATSDDSSDNTDQTQTESSVSETDNFDNRVSQVRLRYKSGTGKKAEVRKTKKGKKGTSSSGSGMYLPPVPLKESVSEGLNVEFGFTPYSEMVNGRIAIVGLTALILVELATGEGVIKYHSPAIILIQVYFMAAASALFVKYEKEKVSVWPQTQSAASSSSAADK